MKLLITLLFSAATFLLSAQVNYPEFKDQYSLCGFPNAQQAVEFAHAYDSVASLEIVGDTFGYFNKNAGFAHYKAYLVLDDPAYLESAIPYFKKSWFTDGNIHGLWDLGGMYSCQENADSTLKYTEMYIQEARKTGQDSLIDYQQIYYRYKFDVIGKIPTTKDHINVLLTSYNTSYLTKIQSHRNDLNTQFKDKEHSPLTPQDRKKFKALAFFPIDSTYRVTATFTRAADTPPFKMKTSTDRLPEYQLYGTLTFDLHGKKQVLEVYQSLRLRVQEKYSNNLFLPFTDETSGAESYGGGRYLDVKIPKGNTLVLDFNKAYNPYCAYSYRYSCPIPPAQNHIQFPVKAGVKKFH